MRALRDRARGHRPPPRQPAGGQGARPGRPLAGADALGAAPGGFDLALGHGSNDVSVAARLLRIPCSTMFDYEWATVQHNVNCRLAQAVVVPEAIPPERLYRYGARRKLRRYAGLKEEYYLADFEPDPAVLTELGLDPGAADRRGAHAAVGLALPPLRERRVRRRPAAAAGHADRRAPAGGRAAGAARRLHRARAGHRRPVAGRPGRPRDQRGRHHEPRGGGPRHTGVDDLRGPPRRRRRSPHRGGSPAAPGAPRRSSSWPSARRERPPSAVRRDPALLVDLLCSPAA